MTEGPQSPHPPPPPDLGPKRDQSPQNLARTTEIDKNYPNLLNEPDQLPDWSNNDFTDIDLE